MNTKNTPFSHLRQYLIPNAGTLVLMALMLFAYSAWAAPASRNPAAMPASAASTGVIPFQGALTDPDGSPLTGDEDMTFRLYNLSSGGTALWTEAHTGTNAVPVEAGLFQVMLGGLIPIPASVWDNDVVYLGVQVGDDPEMTPRELVGKLPASITAEHADNASNADIAQTVPDGSITNAKLNLLGNLDLGDSASTGAIWSGNYNNLMFENTGGNIRNIAANSMLLFIDADNNTDDAYFTILHDNSALIPPVEALFTIYETGGFWVKGGVQASSMIENNLQTPTEMEAKVIERFSQGDVLCWDAKMQMLEKCGTAASILVVAIADENGKPVVLGAKPIKVLGPVKPGDLLVASDIAGYAVAWSQIGTEEPPTGTVIAKALEGFDGEYGMVKAMIVGR